MCLRDLIYEIIDKRKVSQKVKYVFVLKVTFRILSRQDANWHFQWTTNIRLGK